MMAKPDFEIDPVMRRSHLEHAGAELEVHLFVADDRDKFLIARALGWQRTKDVLADELGIARIFWVHGDRGVSGNRFRTRGGDDEKRAGPFGDFDFEVVEGTFLFLHDDFLVRQGGE